MKAAHLYVLVSVISLLIGLALGLGIGGNRDRSLNSENETVPNIGKSSLEVGRNRVRIQFKVPYELANETAESLGKLNLASPFRGQQADKLAPFLDTVSLIVINFPGEELHLDWQGANVAGEQGATANIDIPTGKIRGFDFYGTRYQKYRHPQPVQPIE